MASSLLASSRLLPSVGCVVRSSRHSTSHVSRNVLCQNVNVRQSMLQKYLIHTHKHTALLGRNLHLNFGTWSSDFTYSCTVNRQFFSLASISSLKGINNTTPARTLVTYPSDRSTFNLTTGMDQVNPLLVADCFFSHQVRFLSNRQRQSGLSRRSDQSSRKGARSVGGTSKQPEEQKSVSQAGQTDPSSRVDGKADSVARPGEGRTEASASSVNSTEDETKTLTLYQRFKKTYKEHGKVLVAVHLFTSAIWFGSFYTIASLGFDIVPLLESWNLSDKIISPFRSGGLGNVAVAYLMYKLATPARYTVTIGGTNLAIRYLKREGRMKVVPQEDSLRAMYKEGKQEVKARSKSRLQRIRNRQRSRRGRKGGTDDKL